MQPIKFAYFVYGSGTNLRPLDQGTALYARAWVREYECVDFWWDSSVSAWVESDHLWRLLSKGEVDLDSVDESDLPQGFPCPEL